MREGRTVRVSEVRRDVLNELRQGERRAQEEATAKRRQVLWEIAKILLTAGLAALFVFLFQMFSDWLKAKGWWP